jgi:hypothetical protein
LPVTPIGALEASALGTALRDSTWLLPAIKAVHLAGISTLVGTIAVLDLRLLGVRRSLPVRRLAARVLPWSAGSFLLIVPSGLAMFVARAGELIASPVFALKMCLIMAAGINAAVFHAAVFRRAAQWDVDAMPPAAARGSAALSLLLWLSVIACGRWLASF